MDGAWCGAVQELFYRAVQVSRDRHDGAICVGSCAIYRRAALATNGGTVDYRAPEDVHTGFDLRCRRLGAALHPDPAGSWAVSLRPQLLPRSAVPVVRRVHVAAGLAEVLGRRGMRFRTRCCYLRLLAITCTRQCSRSPPRRSPGDADRPAGERALANYVFIAPSMIYNLVVFPAWHRCRFGPTALMAKLLYGWAHVIAIFDILRR